ncbi:hypothetical protein IH980_03255 [Patescibacteria group bacterium]|nr:hypothetical protein [Patescibacteria group bacterium]
MAYLLGFLFLGMPFFLYNQYFLGNYLLGSYALITDAFHLPKLTSLAGLLISPSRGLFIYSPVFLFSFFGAFLLVKSSFSRRTYFLKLLGLVGVLYLLFLSGFASWTGSWSYGPRYLTDLLPILAIYLSYFINHLLRRNFRYKQFYFSVFFIAAIFSFFVQYIGAFYFTYQWDARVEKSGVSFEEAAWDWKSPQILSIFSE